MGSDALVVSIPFCCSFGLVLANVSKFRFRFIRKEKENSNLDSLVGFAVFFKGRLEFWDPLLVLCLTSEITWLKML